ncbi:MAG: YbaM family protein [Gammaproteobacteria bacterium]|nr:YbaM family protein [Gammaproteobacteria bacterium]MBU2058826.1 YbaM family protein [Gammaproteobacteria bacterium]MBU2177111.1 YbaM family protein [Gammaproteobacteria bacterium]MBU2247097.1 YbaM family protein [Gammaproteobacteria bacterium]MBU2343589.1 YbaM family protein [Gammaproteobacteria bacterium]
MTKTKTPVLSEAPLEVQLAVELILLLEQQDLPPNTVLAALEIVQRDFKKKAQSDFHTRLSKTPAETD